MMFSLVVVGRKTQKTGGFISDNLEVWQRCIFDNFGHDRILSNVILKMNM